MKTTFALAAMAGCALAFPVMDDPKTAKTARALLERYQQAQPRDLSNDPLGISKAQTNCGQVFLISMPPA